MSRVDFFLFIIPVHCKIEEKPVYGLRNNPLRPNSQFVCEICTVPSVNVNHVECISLYLSFMCITSTSSYGLEMSNLFG